MMRAWVKTVRAPIMVTLLVIGVLSSACGSSSRLGKLQEQKTEVVPGSTYTSTAGLHTPRSPTVNPTPTSPVDAAGEEIEEQDAASRVIPVLKPLLPKGPRRPEPIGLIVSSIGLDAKVVPLGTHYNEAGNLVWDTAAFAVGHHRGTANPGEVGNVVLSGHISSLREGSVFARLPDVAVGDGVIVITSDRNYVYQVVEKKVVEPTQVDVLKSTGDFTLTMITCVPDGVYTHRLVVTAKQI